MKDTNKSRRSEYASPSTTKYEVQPGARILAGSVTGTEITFSGAEAVKVKEYDNGFDNADGFGTISF